VKHFTFSPSNAHTENGDLIEVTLNPPNFTNVKKFSPLIEVNDKWFMNLSHQNIPQHVELLVQLGQNFSMPAINQYHTKTNITQFIKNVEHNIINLETEVQTDVRNKLQFCIIYCLKRCTKIK